VADARLRPDATTASGVLSVAIDSRSPVPLSVSFSCAPGDVLGIYGPSGSGKTTILRTVAGLHQPSSVRVVVGSNVWADSTSRVFVPPHRRAVGLVFQDYALFPHLTALDNVMTALTHRPRGERRPIATKLLEQVDLTGKQRHRPAELSGGERQRVAVARALAREPAVLLFDEPFASVDRSVRRRLQDLVDSLRRTTVTPMLLVTHDFEDIVRLASHLLVIEGGRAIASGALRDVTSQPDARWPDDTTGHGSVFDATVTDVDTTRGLATLAFTGGALVAPHRSLAAGSRVRVRIPARDVILATDVPAGVSLHNALPGVVAAVEFDQGDGQVVVRLSVGAEYVLAEVTRDAVARLGIREGTRLHLLIKSVSLQVLPV
jgi:molybdate transport system ATP-binding protein